MDTTTVDTLGPAIAASAGTALELRVAEGPQAGATAPLVAGAACVLATAPDGDADDADLVLREDGAAATRVRIVAGADVATVDVLQGEVTIGAARVVAGSSAPWRARTPLRIGTTAIAFGPADEPAWTDADPVDPQAAWDLAVEHIEKLRAPGAGPGASATPAPAAPVARRRRVRVELWLAAAGAVAVLGCAGALVLRDAPPPPAPVAAVEPAVRLAEALQAGPFAALEVVRDPLGRITLTGRLATIAERAQLDAWLAQQPVPAGVAVHVDESIVRDVTDVFRVNGVAVKARVAGPGRVEVDAAERDPAVLARAEEVVRRDVRGLAGLEVVNRVAPAPKPAPPVVDDPAKRIASVVPGHPAHLVTADGARYFVGALLPGNQRIVRIAGTAVTLERDGETTTLAF